MGNWLDKLIGFISPSSGYEREAWRQELDSIRNYDAGSRDRVNANWKVFNNSAEMTDRYSRDEVRARARDLERNSDMANSILGAYKRNIIGGGYGLQARTPDEELNRKIEKYWKIWCKKNNCDVTQTQSLNQMLRMAIKRKKVDGGMIFHKVFTSGGLLPFKLQCLEVDELDISQTTPKYKENKVVGGIEYDNFNRAVGYWIRQYEIDGFSIRTARFVEEKDIIFYFTKERPSQLREMSDLSPTITRIRDANEFMNAVSVKERILACLAVFIKKIIPQGGLGRSKNGAVYEEYNGKTLTPGMINYLNPGDDVHTVNPSGQATDATSYIKLQQRLMGAGQGISYEATTRDMSESTYSSTRQGMIEDDLTYEGDKELILEVLDEIYETFIISGWLVGLFQIKDFWDKKDEYFLHEWIQTPKRWIDPAKEANANKIALQYGQKTFKQICSENGRDWQETIQDIAEVKKYGEELGVDIMSIIYGQKKQEGGIISESESDTRPKKPRD